MKRNFISMLSIVIGSICFVFSIAVQAQNPQILTLDEAVSLGIAHSKTLQTDSLNLQIADAKLMQSNHAHLPQISVNLSYIRISDNITPFSVSFPTGDVVLNPQILNQSYNTFQVRQLVWAGGKVKYGNQLAVFDKKAIYFDIQKNRADVGYNITTLWYNLFTVRQSEKIVRANLELLENQRKDAENLVGQGILLGNDLLKLELAFTNLQSSLSDIENTENLLKYNICVLTGLDTKTAIDVPENLPITAAENNNLDQYMETALRNRAELKGLAIRKEQTLLGMKIARSYYQPTFSLGGTVNSDQPNIRIFPAQETFTTTWNVGAFLSWNLTDLYTTKQKIRESRLLAQKLNTATDQAREGIQIEVNTDYNNYLQAKRKIDITSKAVEQATENFRVEQNKFQNNTATSTDFLNANTLLLQAQINQTTAIANAALAYRKLLKSIN
jgi:outer membrane protein